MSDKRDDQAFDVGLGLKDTHVLITGASGQIGFRIVQAFLSADCHVSALDLKPLSSVQENLLDKYTGKFQFFAPVDITSEIELEQTFTEAISRSGGSPVNACVAAAGLDLSFIPHWHSICDLPLEQFRDTVNVNLTGTFLTAKTWMRMIRDRFEYNAKKVDNVSFIAIGSEAGVFGVPGTADYAASKAGVQYGLVKSIAVEAVGIYPTARVNAIAPGPVNTPQFMKECDEDESVRYLESEATVTVKTAVPVDSVARACLMLASDTYSSHISGQCIQVDGGKIGRVNWLPGGRQSW